MSTPVTSRRDLATCQRLVVKVGSSSLTDSTGHLDIERLGAIVTALADRRETTDTQVVLVSSGAQAAAMGPLGLKQKPNNLAMAQAAASVGQGLLVAEYTRAFSYRGIKVGQILLTAEDVLRRGNYKNAFRALEALLHLGVLPIVNENDAVATDEIRFGDNDRLAALVAHLVKADALVLLTDVDALYTAPPTHPGAQKVEVVEHFDQVENLDIKARGSAVGTGGMVTKVHAAAMATSSGIPVLLTSAENIRPALGGENVGTFFKATGRRLSPRQMWLGYAAKISGKIVVDEGAMRAVTERHASLLPAGVVQVEGQFKSGDCVEIVDQTGRPIAHGVSGFSAETAPKVMGLSMDRIESSLGAEYAHEMVHRDDLVVMARYRRN